METINIGDAIEYVDVHGHGHSALVTAVHGTGQTPSINVVYVTGDSAKTDQYGWQIERETSVSHEEQQAAHGRFWRVLK